MKQYEMPILQGVSPSIEALTNVPAAPIACFPWPEKTSPYTPESRAQLACFDAGIAVLLSSTETPVRHEVTEQGGPVYQDSCLEFFVNADPQASDRYLNFECNPKGVLHLAIGDGRHGRTLISGLDFRSYFGIQATIRADGWQVYYVIPHDFIRAHYAGYQPASGWAMKGNFYKCGDSTVHPHLACWNPITIATPDFHRPEFFAPIIIR